MKKTFTVIALVLLAGSYNRYLDIKPYGQTIPETAEEFSALLHAHLDEIDYGEEVVMGDGLEMADLAIRIIRGLVYRWLQNLIWRRSLLAVLITRPSNGSKRI